MTIRPATQRDLEACARICETEELRFANGDYATPNFLSNFLDEQYFLVAEQAGTVVGCAFGEPVKAEGAILWFVAVTPEKRGEGIGQSLIKAFEENCRRSRRQWLSLFSADTKQHERLYTKLGFEQGKRYVLFEKDF